MRRLLFVLALAALIPACGGGGGGAAGPAFQTVDLGLVSSTTSTLVVVEIDNPRSQAVEVTRSAVSGPFRVLPGTLPLNLGAGETLDLPVQYIPDGQIGPTEGELILDFTGSATTQRGLNLSADAERVRIAVLTSALNFGEVLSGDSKDLPIDVRNRSVTSVAHCTQVTLPTDFSVVTPLPLAITPGQTASLVIRYAPNSGGAPSGTAAITCDDPTGPFLVPLTAVSGGREVVDFGIQVFDASLSVPGNFSAQTQDLQFALPSDAISFQIEAYCDATTQIGLSLLRGPGGEDFENENFTGFYLQYPDVETFVAQVPNTDDPTQQLVTGTWAFRIGRLVGPNPTVDVRVIIQRRPGGDDDEASLDLNIFLADGIVLTAANSGTDADLQDVLSRVDGLLAQQGIRIGDIDYYDVADLAPVPSVYDDVSNAEFPGLLALSGDPLVQEERLNFFLVREALGGGVLGVSAKLGGPTKNGTGASGVMGLYIDDPSTNQRDLVARVMAHEIGHYVGLRHTAEANGSHDDIDDTTECGSSSCSLATEKYLMHWQANGGHSVLTDGQGLVIRGHGHMRPRGAEELAITSVLPQVHVTTAYDITVSENWCATCKRCKSKDDLGLGK